MKALAIILALFLSTTASFAGSGIIDGKGDKNPGRLKEKVDRQVNRHLYFPQGENKEELIGSAEVLLQVTPGGKVRAIHIKAKNPIVRAFIERQVEKMKVEGTNANEEGLFRYRIEFTRQ